MTKIDRINETDEIDEMKQVSCFRTNVPSVIKTKLWIM